MKSKRKLRVFEAFAGIGAQAAALKKLNIDYEIVGNAVKSIRSAISPKHRLYI